MQQWVIMATFYTIQEAHLAATYLSSHAIEARIENENSNSILPVYGLSAAGIRLLVPVELAREAFDLLEKYLPSEGGSLFV
jgi:hypothetical protein